MSEDLSRRKFLYVAGGLSGATIAGLAGCTSGNETSPDSAPETASSDLQRLVDNKIVYGTSYVSPQVEHFGDVFIGAGSFIAGNTILRAAPDLRVEIGNETNAQDNVVIRALEDSLTIADETSLAHHAIVRDSSLGNFVFVGFQTRVLNSRVGDGCLIQAGAQIIGVDLPEGSLVAPGQIIDSQDIANALPRVDESAAEFQREVLHVNAEFAKGYIQLYEEEGYDAVLEIGPNPPTEFRPERIDPQIGPNVILGEFVRIVGDVRIARNARVRQRSAIRADEGSPIIIGEGADIGNRVTFHALAGTELVVGDFFTVDDDAVIHGPLQVGHRVIVGEASVVFRVIIGDDVVIGNGVILQGPAGEGLSLSIPPGTRIPDGSVVTDESTLRQATGI